MSDPTYTYQSTNSSTYTGTSSYSRPSLPQTPAPTLSAQKETKETKDKEADWGKLLDKFVDQLGTKLDGAAAKIAQEMKSIQNELQNIRSELKTSQNLIGTQQSAIQELKDEVKLLRAQQQQQQQKQITEAPSEGSSWFGSKPSPPKVKSVRVFLTDEEVKLVIPTQSVLTRLKTAASRNSLNIDYVQGGGVVDATIVVQGHTLRPQEEEVKKKLKKYSGERIIVYLQINKDTTRKASPEIPLVSDIPGIHMFHFIGDKDGLNPISTWQSDQEDALIRVLQKLSK